MTGDISVSPVQFLPMFFFKNITRPKNHQKIVARPFIQEGGVRKINRKSAFWYQLIMPKYGPCDKYH